MHIRLYSLLLIGSLSIAAAAAPPPEAWMPTRQIEVTLLDAQFGGRTPEESPGSLLVLLETDGKQWKTPVAVARDVSPNVQTGRIEEAAMTDDTLSMTLFMNLRSPDWAIGDHGRFSFELRRQQGEHWKGTYSGTFRGQTVRGQAEAQAMDVDARPGWNPIDAGEHPRILFRKADLPALRKKADTPLGKAALARMDGPIGDAIRVQLSGNRKLAQQMIPEIEKLMDRGLTSDQFGNNVGDRLEKVAIAYDCCRDYWPAEFRRRVEAYLYSAANGVLRADQSAGGGINWHVCSNWSAPLYAGAAFAGLALYGEKGPKPTPPAPTQSGQEIAAADDYTPGKGVPVVDFANDAMPGDWIYAGGIALENDRPVLPQAGKTRPQVGDAIRHGRQSDVWKPLSREKDKGYYTSGGREMVDITNAVGRRLFTRTWFFAVVRNDKPRWVQVRTDYDDASVYLNGVVLRNGEVARLDKGLYPMLVEADIGWMNAWGRHLMRPRLAEISAEQAAALAGQARDDFEARRRDYDHQLQRWTDAGGIDPRYVDLLQRSRAMMYRFCREAVGTGGMTAEITHYGGIAERGPSRYAPAHWQMLGYHVSAQRDIEVLAVRKMFVHVYPDSGDPRAQEISGTPKIGSDLFAPLLAVTPPQYRPAVLWGWQRHAGGEEPAGLVADEPLWALLNYPDDPKPQPPGKVLPLTWQAPGFGFYGFRDRWDGRDAFIAQVWGKSWYIGGWNGPNAGTFRLMGLGHVWADGPTDRNRHRWEESVVQLPENEEINEGLGARTTFVKTFDDGSGIVSFDMNDVYAVQKKDDKGRGPRARERYGNIRNPEAFGDSGITGMRAIAVDYSGLSGSACLLVLVDRIDGGKAKVWTWQLARPDKDSPNAPDDVKNTRVEGNRFVVTKPDGASLAGTFITGQKPYATVRQTSMIGHAGSSAGKKLARPIHGVFADDDSGRFFVVVTVQKGDAPAVQVEGKGLDATVTVGRRTIRFDGEKIVLGTRP